MLTEAEIDAAIESKTDQEYWSAPCRVCHRPRRECESQRRRVSPVIVSNNPSDPINHPSHYTDGGIETIDFIEAKKLNFNLGNAVKYISRAGKKAQNNGHDVLTETAIIDIEKAVWYLNRELTTLKGK